MDYSGGGMDPRIRAAQGHQINLREQVTLASWPTPNAGPQNDGDTTWEQRRQDLKAKHGNGFGLTLGQASSLASWPTATVNDATGSNYAYSSGNHDKPVLKLPGAVELASWATASARDWKDSPGMAETGTNPDGSTRTRLDQLPRQAALASGQAPSGSTAETAKPGQLNPAFSLWLQGYPTEWARCAARVTPSSRKSRQK